MTETALITKKVERHITQELVIDHMPVTQTKLREEAGRLEMAQAEFGLGLDAKTLHDRIRGTLPWKWREWNWPHTRTTEWWAVAGEGWLRVPREVWQRIVNPSWGVSEYPRVIPDAALVAYETALRTGWFEHFWVIEATYWTAPPVGADPWLVGQIGDRYIVLAYWD